MTICFHFQRVSVSRVCLQAKIWPVSKEANRQFAKHVYVPDVILHELPGKGMLVAMFIFY